MIRATVARTVWASGVTGYEVKAEGHAGAGEYGQDIVCAAVSVLLQTLANEVTEAARAGLLAVGVVAHGDGWMKVEMTPTDQTQDMADAWVELVQDGIDALAESYPENVELEVHYVYADTKELEPDKLADMVSGKMNLQYFAEGGDGGAGAAEGGAAEAAAPAVQEPALRPAQERLARRSGALKGKAAGGEKLPQPPAGGSPLKEGASGSESDPAEAEKHQEPAKEPKAEKTPEERRRAFGEMVQGEYSDVFQEMMQRAIDKATENIRQNPQVARLTQALANAYGVDTDDMDGLIEAVENGRVKDEKYYEDLAQQRGVSVKTARELDKMESDLKRSNTRNAQLQAMQQEATRQQRVSQIQAQWEAQAAQLKTQYPDFELQEVLANEQVADLMRRGVSLPDAYRAAYFDHIMQQATAQTAQKVEQGVAARIQQRASRPGENGTRPGGAVTTHVDVASMSRRQLEDLERRARRGEKITL
jgi:uncharacterized protein YsxB (DUF464 family)